MDWNRTLSGLLALVYIIIAFTCGGAAAALKTTIGIIFPLACIWFGDEMGQWSGTIRLQFMTSPTPGCLVRFGGWLVLLLPVVVVPILYFSSH